MRFLSTRKMNPCDPISEEWLKSVGFRWDEFPRSGGKHWTLWFGGLTEESFASFEDIGIEVTPAIRSGWHCWMRSDVGRKYDRFIHIRYVRTIGDVIQIVVALSGVPWRPENHLYGSIRTEKEAEHIRQTESRADRIVAKAAKWAEHEKDESQARPEVRDSQNRGF